MIRTNLRKCRPPNVRQSFPPCAVFRLLFATLSFHPLLSVVYAPFFLNNAVWLKEEGRWPHFLPFLAISVVSLLFNRHYEVMLHLNSRTYSQFFGTTLVLSIGIECFINSTQRDLKFILCKLRGHSPRTRNDFKRIRRFNFQASF